MMSSLEFKAFKATAAKVKILRFHPVQPWLAFTDTNQSVVVWNWSTEQVVCEFQLAAAEEVAAQDLLLQQLAQRDSQFYGSPPSETAGMPKSASPGSVKDIRFLDTETCFWQLAWQHSQQLKAYSSSGIPHIGRVRGLRGHRWLVLACEAKVVLHDLRSGDMRELPRSLLDGRAPTCLAFLFVNLPSLLGFGSSDSEATTTTITPIVAVGTGNGQIFLFSLSTLQVHARLGGVHKSAVTELITLSAKEAGSPDGLISTAADGTVAVWEPSVSTIKLPEREITAKHSFKAHDGEILSAALIASPSDSPGAGQLYLVTSGEDKRVAVWDANTWKEVAKAKPLPKGTCDSLGYSPRAGACCGSEPVVLLTSGERPCVWGMFPTSRQLETSMLANLEGLLLPGTKKVPKIYKMACHPLQPHLVAVGANAGIGLLSFNPAHHVPAAGLPLQLPAAADLESPRAGAPFRGCDYMFASDSSLWQVSFRQGWREDVAGKHLTADLRSRRSVAKLPRHGRAEVQVSSDGACCSVVWPDEGEFAIYRPASAGDAWDRLDGGAGIAVAWAAAAPLYAVIHTPRAADAKKQKRKPTGKGKEDDSARASAAALASGAVVQVYSVSQDSFSVQLVCNAVSLGGESPAALHGGAMLGVALQKTVRTGQRRGRAMRLVSWNSFAAVGPTLTEPTWQAWDPDVTCLAMGYPDALVLCRLQPSVSAFASLPLQGTYHGHWQRHQLFTASPTSVHCVFTAAGPATSQPFVEAVKLASLGGGAAAQMVSVGNSTASLPTEGMRPGGPVTLLGVREGALWLVDARGLPFVLPLSHAGMRARSVAAHGDAAAACVLAEHGLWRHHHDSFALFVAAVAPRGAERALQLSGLTLRGEAALARRSGALRRALQCLAAAAVGARDRAALNTHALWHARAAPGQGVQSLAELVAGPARPHTNTAPIVPVLEKLPPPPQPEPQPEVQADANGDAPAEEDATPEAPEQVRRRQLLRILIPDDNEVPVSDDEPEDLPKDKGNKEKASTPAGVNTDAFEAGSDSSYDEVDFGGTASRAPPPDPGVPVDWDLPLSTAAGRQTQHAADAGQPLGLQEAWVLDECLALIEAALIAGEKEVASISAQLALQSARGATQERQVAALLACARCEALDDVTTAVALLVEGSAASPVSHAITLASSLADDAAAVTAALQGSGLAAAAAMYTHAWRSGDAIKTLAAWSSGLNLSSTSAAKYAVARPSA